MYVCIYKKLDFIRRVQDLNIYPLRKFSSDIKYFIPTQTASVFSSQTCTERESETRIKRYVRFYIKYVTTIIPACTSLIMEECSKESRK